LLSSFASVKKGEIPITFILIFVIFVGRELYDGIFVKDNISQLGHILGGLVGSVIGFALNRNNGKSA
jgi:GlpG protein